jgi:hypothetical protein
MIVGGLVVAGGLIVTIVSAASASGGGRYVFAWGAILFGAIAFIRGLFSYMSDAGTGAPGNAAIPSVKTHGGYPGTGAPAHPATAAPLAVRYGSGDGTAATGNAGAVSPSPKYGNNAGQAWTAQIRQIAAAPGQTASAQPRMLTELSVPARILAEALVGVVRDAAAVTAAELAAIHSTLLHQLGATLKEDDIRALALARVQSPDGVVAFVAKGNGALDSAMRATIVRGVFFVMMANGPRPYAMPGTVALGNSMGLSEAEVKELVGDMARPLDGQRREVVLTLGADALRRGTATFRYTVLVPCTACGGLGADCKVCNEDGRVSSQQDITIAVRADVKTGDRLQYAEKGDSPMSGGRPGNLFVEVAMKAD